MPELPRRRPYEMTISESALRPYYFDVTRPFARPAKASTETESITVGKRYPPKACRYDEIRHVQIISDDITIRAPRKREHADFVRTVVFEVSDGQTAQLTLTVPNNYSSIAQAATLYLDSAVPEPVCVPIPQLSKARMQELKEDFYLDYPERHPDEIEKKRQRTGQAHRLPDERHRADEEYTNEYDWQPKLRITKQFPCIGYRLTQSSFERERKEWVFEYRGTTSKTAAPLHPPASVTAPPVPTPKIKAATIAHPPAPPCKSAVTVPPALPKASPAHSKAASIRLPVELRNLPLPLTPYNPNTFRPVSQNDIWIAPSKKAPSKGFA